jgi:hypothetical protein
MQRRNPASGTLHEYRIQTYSGVHDAQDADGDADDEMENMEEIHDNQKDVHVNFSSTVNELFDSKTSPFKSSLNHQPESFSSLSSPSSAFPSSSSTSLDAAFRGLLAVMNRNRFRVPPALQQYVSSASSSSTSSSSNHAHLHQHHYFHAPASSNVFYKSPVVHLQVALTECLELIELSMVPQAHQLKCEVMAIACNALV